MPAVAEKYVVQHRAVGHRLEGGDVVTRERLMGEVRVDAHDGSPAAGLRAVSAEEAAVQTQANLARLIALGAVRPATEFEAGQERVTLPTGKPGVALEQALRDRGSEVDVLRLELSQAREEIRRLRDSPPPLLTSVPSLDTAKEREYLASIDGLKVQLEAERARVAELEAERAAPRKR